MNDYAITKWAGELICMNSAKMFGTETVRVCPVNCYGPYEHYTHYRGFIPKFIYLALHNKPYTVFKGHKRIIEFVEDFCRTWANIIENFIPGEVYNVAGRPEWEKDIKEYSDLVLKFVGVNDSRFTYEEAEAFKTKVKTIDCSKAIRDLKHNPKVSPEAGIRRTVYWMKKHYLWVNKLRDYASNYGGKNILVTGGAGAIGGNLCRKLSEMNAQKVIVLDDLYLLMIVIYRRQIIFFC